MKSIVQDVFVLYVPVLLIAVTAALFLLIFLRWLGGFKPALRIPSIHSLQFQTGEAIATASILLTFSATIMTFGQAVSNSHQLKLIESQQSIDNESKWPLLLVESTDLQVLDKNTGQMIIHLNNGGLMPGVIREIRSLPYWPKKKRKGALNESAEYEAKIEHFDVSESNIVFGPGLLSTKPAIRVDLTPLKSLNALLFVFEIEYCTATLPDANCRTTLYRQTISHEQDNWDSSQVMQMFESSKHLKLREEKFGDLARKTFPNNGAVFPPQY